ncbi:MAG TPA: ribonuclease HII [Candidatus Thermoplasmatota archaeon]|nr:ribonuclease HII [Candidatus Thermoplasmatota archaeon]
MDLHPLAPRVLAGIDEAGRGPVLGPLVVAGVATEDPERLAEMGCRDSKVLSPDRRRALDRALRADAGVQIEVRAIEAETIDAEREGRSLNDIELERFAEVARALGSPAVVVDAADVDAKRFGRDLAARLPPGTRVVSEHKADANHAIVAAASIVAKVARDAAVAELARRLERRLGMALGSGYPSDPQTQAFLRAWVERFGDLPEGTRRSWSTARDLLAPRPARLDDFGGRR